MPSCCGFTSKYILLPCIGGGKQHLFLVLLALSISSSNPIPSKQASACNGKVSQSSRIELYTRNAHSQQCDTIPPDHFKGSGSACLDWGDGECKEVGARIVRLVLRGGGGKRLPITKRGRQPPSSADLASAVAAIINSPTSKQAGGPDPSLGGEDEEGSASLPSDSAGKALPARGSPPRRAVRAGHEPGRIQPAYSQEFGDSDKVSKAAPRSRVKGSARSVALTARSTRGPKVSGQESVERDCRHPEVLPDGPNVSGKTMQNLTQGADAGMRREVSALGYGSGSSQELEKAGAAIWEAMRVAERRAEQEASRRMDAEKLSARLAEEVKAARSAAAMAVPIETGNVLGENRRQIVLGLRREGQMHGVQGGTIGKEEEDSQEEKNAMRIAAEAAEIRLKLIREAEERRMREREEAAARRVEEERVKMLQEQERRRLDEERRREEAKRREEERRMEEERRVREEKILEEEREKRRLEEEELVRMEAQRVREEAERRAQEEENKRREEEEARAREEEARVREAEERMREEQERVERLRRAREAEEGFLDRCAVIDASLAAGENDQARTLVASLKSFVDECGGMLGQAYGVQVEALAARVEAGLQKARDVKAGWAEVERGKACVDRGEWEFARSCFRTARAAFDKTQVADGLAQVKDLLLWVDDAQAKATMGKAVEAVNRVEALLKVVQKTLALGAAGEEAAEHLKHKEPTR